MPPQDERAELDSLVQGYTLGGAHQLGIADELGSLTVGKRADLVVLDRDLFSVVRCESLSF